MKIIFRTDASHQIGTGHVMRCLTLVRALRERGAECRFVCRGHPGNLIALIREQGFETAVLPLGEQGVQEGSPPEEAALANARWLGNTWGRDAQATIAALDGIAPDWLIVDHYALDARWESALRPHVGRIMVIDDLADRPHDCDLLLDQNLVADMTHRYDGKLPAHCGGMLGPEYALLQPQYADLHTRTPPREGPVQRVLIYFGGADAENLTGRAIAAFVSLRRDDIKLDVVINPGSPHADAVREQVRGHLSISLYEGVPSLAPLMVKADLAIGAGGATSWERCCLGLPTLIITLAENQKPIAAELDRRGLARWLGHHDEVDEIRLIQALEELTASALTPAWSEDCQRVADGKGTQRVCSILLLNAQTALRARLARLEDEALILNWANDPVVRQNAFVQGAIDPATHRDWFRKRLRDLENCRLYVVETQDGLPVGQVRFERTNVGWEVHYALDSRLRGRGLGVPLVRTVLEAARQAGALDGLFGRVKPENHASRKVFLTLGFNEEVTASELIYREANG
jgi:UDP-2,4-diacetamido-2,4,6-trideoxy-beta-L-altropyranose hydrolase